MRETVRLADYICFDGKTMWAGVKRRETEIIYMLYECTLDIIV